MPVSRRRAAVRAGARVVALLVAAAGCGKSDMPAADSPRSAATPAAPSAGTNASSNADPRKPACPRTGHWVDCQVRERLVRSGLAPRDTSRDELPALGPTPAVLRLGRGALAVYLFADSATRARAATRLDSVKYVRAPNPLTMLSTATVIENDNLLALLFSKNDQQIERVSDALMAGPPQP
jgi:hypothetical protein